MKIVRSTREAHKFEAIKAFYFEGKSVKKGDIIVIEGGGDQTGFVQRGMVIPIDTPKKGVYIALRPIVLPGATEKFECKRLELIELTKAQAIKLMIEGSVIPKSPRQWRPRNAHLRSEKR